jgi:cytochrome d ubiquinol oxidase subunit I
MAAVITPVQIGVGDWAAHFVAANQPVKLAAMEGVFHTARGVPLHIGGIEVGGRLRYSIEIPFGLSLLAHWDPHAEIKGLDTVPADQRPKVNIVHPAFDLMVGSGLALLALGVWFSVAWKRRRALPPSRWFLRGAAAGGVLAVVALEGGWVVTEVGRQPWIVYGVLRTSDAVSAAPGLRLGFFAVVVVYVALTAGAVYALRRLARTALPSAPQERDVDEVPVA